MALGVLSEVCTKPFEINADLPFASIEKLKSGLRKRAFIAIQPWLAEPLFLRPLREEWTHLHRHHHQRRVRRSGAERKSTRPHQLEDGLARPSDLRNGRWVRIHLKDPPL